ncbi:c-terminal processing peptidase-2 Serine peptidase MEROPS family S41A [Clostridium sp. CAG:967]|nr:c-terminal processing peptidase-2 Serine peptidase MEROPS family S41A [Clostridium sp. CAG:967]
MRNIMKKSIIFLGAFLFLSGWVIRDNVFAYSPVDLYDNVWRLVNTKFVDQTNNAQNWSKWRHKYDNKILTNEDAYVAINTMVASLNDPYTKFLDPKEFADETNSIKGSLKGIGIQIGVKDGKLMVIAPIEDTPAEKAGLLADDEILEIDGVSTKGITVDKAADKIRGKEGTQVTLLVKRKDAAPKTYTITRAEIEIKSISQKIPDKISMPDDLCYIRLSSFISRNAASEFGSILNNAKDKKGFIIDLRSNPGGLLTNAIYISDMFLDGGTIVSTVDRDGYKETQRASSGVYTRKPVVVLINKGSASASEIFSGAMKDNHRAVIIGEQSFGKGLVQEINKLPYEAGINITIQKYLTPNGTDINKKGITPDIEVKLTEEDIKNKNDVQLKKAIEVLSKMTNGQSLAVQ